MADAIRAIVTCEHGGNRVPRPFVDLFRPHRRLLASHRGWDPGALPLARELARALRAPLLAATVTRLLVDLNRSPGNPRVFSEATRGLPRARRAALLQRYHAPHHSAVLAAATPRSRGERVLHLAVHTFTPVLEGRVRTVDVGVLYDPGRAEERAFADRFIAALGRRRPELRLRRNAPYRGVADGLPTLLRRRLPDPAYSGIELEVNQRFPLAGGAAWTALRRAIVASCVEAATARRALPP